MKHLIAVAALIIPSFVCMAEVPEEVTRGLSGQRDQQIAASSPTITIARDGVRVKITFTGTLQSANTISGPWFNVTNAASPLNEDPSSNQKFYRTRGTPESIFSSRSVVTLTVTGPLQNYFEQAFAGTPDGIFPPRREKPYFDGTIKVADLEFPASLRVRGNSSLQECPFPKLKFKVAREDRAGTPFFDAREIKIGTHCAEGDGSGNIGRLRDERATFREALAYESMELMGFHTPRVRRARIDYRDTTPTGEGGSGSWQVRRNAIILDDVEVVAERLGGRALEDEELNVLTNAAFGQQLITELRLFHTLLGNWDYGLSEDGQGLWNTDVIELANKQLVPVAGDFDLSSWVTGKVRLSAPHDYRPDLPELDRQARYSIEQIQQSVSAKTFIAASNRFAPKRAAIESLIIAAEVDDPGRTNALQHVKAFSDALAGIAGQ